MLTRPTFERATRTLTPLLLGALLWGCAQGGTGTLPATDPYAGTPDHRWADRQDAPVADPYRPGRTFPWQGVTSALPGDAVDGVNALGDVQYTTASNAWGPVEFDRSNGGPAAGDGGPLTIGGQTFDRGMGVHGASELSYTLTGACSLFQARVGVDDEADDRGSVVFQVYGDGVKLFDSGRRTGTDAALAVSVPLTGVRDLRLVVTDAGDGIAYDRADWAGPTVTCRIDSAPSGVVPLGALPTVSATNGWGPVERDRSNGEQRPGDGAPLTIAGQTYSQGIGVHATSRLSYWLGGACTGLSARIGVDDTAGGGGSVVFTVSGDGRELFRSPVRRGAQAALSLDVPLAGVQLLTLEVTDAGDGMAHDRADWAEARLNCTPAPGTLAYADIAPQSVEVSEAQGEVVGGQLYVFGGFDLRKDCCTPTDRAQRYDTDRWTARRPMPDGGVTHAGMTTDGQLIYFAGGYVADAARTGQIFGSPVVRSYNPVTDIYGDLPPLPRDIAAGQLEYLNDALHYFGGTNQERTQDLGTHYVLDLSNPGAGWTVAAALPHPRQHMGSAVLGGKIYAVGGQTGHDELLVTQTYVDVYDPGTREWTSVAPLPRARSHISNSTFVMDGRLVVVGGELGHGSPVSWVDLYDPATDRWSSLTPLPEPRTSSAAGALGGGFVVTGGSESSTGWKATPGP